MKFSIAAIFAAASAVMAYTTPVGEPDTDKNPITKPGLQELVPAGKPYTITWTPSRPEVQTVTLVLLRGPSNNIKFHSVIAEKTANSGTFVWTPSTDLEDDVTHYGIQLIQDVDGKYQYSTQFGVSNKNPTKSTTTATTNSTVSSTTSSTATSSTSTKLTTTSKPATNSTLTTSTLTTSSATTLISATVTPSGNGTLPVTTGTLRPSSSPSPTANPNSSAAGRTIASLGLAALFAAVVGLVL